MNRLSEIINRLNNVDVQSSHFNNFRFQYCCMQNGKKKVYAGIPYHRLAKQNHFPNHDDFELWCLIEMRGLISDVGLLNLALWFCKIKRIEIPSWFVLNFPKVFHELD